MEKYYKKYLSGQQMLQDLGRKPVQLQLFWKNKHFSFTIAFELNIDKINLHRLLIQLFTQHENLKYLERYCG